MDFDDKTQSFVWYSRQEMEDLNHEEIVAEMVAKATRGGHLPIDFNHRKVPNVYLRARYRYDRDENSRLVEKEWIEDGFVMFIENLQPNPESD